METVIVGVICLVVGVLVGAFGHKQLAKVVPMPVVTAAQNVVNTVQTDIKK